MTRRDLALQVMRDAATFTVDDPRFSTARSSGRACSRSTAPSTPAHRAPFAGPFRLDAGARALHRLVHRGDRAADRRLRAGRAGRAAPRFAGPLAAAVVMYALGLGAPTPRRARLVRRRSSTPSTGSPRAAAQRRGRTSFAALRAALGPALERDGDSLVARGRAGGLARERGGLERRRAAVRRHRDDRGDDRQRASGTCSRTPTSSRACAPTRRCWPTRSRSRCAWSRPPRWSTATRPRDVELGGAAIGARRPRHASRCRPPTATRRSSPDPDRFDAERANAAPPPRLRARAARLHRDAPRAARGPHRRRAAARAPAGPAPGSGPPGRAARARVPQAARAAGAVASLRARREP